MNLINLLTGFGSSLLSSMIGSFAGGGSSLILFPLLLMLAQGTYASLLTATKLSATMWVGVSGHMHWKRNKLDLRLLGTLVGAGMVGTAIGTYLVQYQLNELLFKQILAVTLLGVGIYLLFSGKIGLDRRGTQELGLRCILMTGVFSMFINVLNGLFGGTGIFITLWLVLLFRMSFIQAIPYTIVSYAIINIPQTLWLVITEPVEPWLVVGVVMGAAIGAHVGTRWLYLKGNTWVKMASIVVMLSIGIRTLISTL